jgi:hypothetical protein
LSAPPLSPLAATRGATVPAARGATVPAARVATVPAAVATVFIARGATVPAAIDAAVLVARSDTVPNARCATVQVARGATVPAAPRGSNVRRQQQSGAELPSSSRRRQPMPAGWPALAAGVAHAGTKADKRRPTARATRPAACNEEGQPQPAGSARGRRAGPLRFSCLMLTCWYYTTASSGLYVAGEATAAVSSEFQPATEVNDLP